MPSKLPLMEAGSAAAGALLLGAAELAELAVLEDEPPQPARDSSIPADSTAANARDSFLMVILLPIIEEKYGGGQARPPRLL